VQGIVVTCIQLPLAHDPHRTPLGILYRTALYGAGFRASPSSKVRASGHTNQEDIRNNQVEGVDILAYEPRWDEETGVIVGRRHDAVLSVTNTTANTEHSRYQVYIIQ
jgi:hypothetical protein